MTMIAIILAGSRSSETDPVAAAAGVPLKALAPVGGEPMVGRVIAALRETGLVVDFVVVVPSAHAKEDVFSALDIRTLNCASSPARSLLEALKTLHDEAPILVTTADHALLDTSMVRMLADGFNASQCDGAVAMVPLEILTSKYPHIKRTRLYFREGGYKSCNLFLFKNKEAVRRAAQFWVRAEDFRKKPWRLALVLGPLVLLRYLTRRLTLEQAFVRLSYLADVRIRPVMLAVPEAAIDADSPEDLSLICRIVKERGL